MKKIIFFVCCLLILSACNLQRAGQGQPAGQPDLLATSVAATLEALENETPLAIPTQGESFMATPFPTMSLAAANTPFFTNIPLFTSTPEPGFGSIAGAIVGYPFGGSPRFAVVAYEQNPPYHYWYWITAPGAASYSMDGYVSSGRYQVVAYSSDGPRGGCVTLIEVRKNETAICDITDWAGAYRDKPADVP